MRARAVLLLGRGKAVRGSMRRVAAAVLSALGWAGIACAQTGERQITEVNVGFGVGRGTDVNLKLGHWVPVTVSVETPGTAEFRGKLVLTTADFDDADNTVVIPNVSIPKAVSGGRGVGKFTTALKFCKDRLPIDVRLVQVEEDGSEREVHRVAKELQSEGRNVNVIPPQSQLICYFGANGALVEIKDKAERSFADNAPTLARFTTERMFPTQWIGYGGVDAFVLMTANVKLFDQLPPDRQSALRTWVRQGGHLVVCCAKNWQIVRDSFLGPMLPAKLDGVVELDVGKSRIHETLTNFALPGGSRKADPSFDPTKVKTVPFLKVSAPRGKTRNTQDDLPWLVDGAYGLGRVTLVGFDFEDPPLSQWAKAGDFWTQLLKLYIPKDEENQNRFAGMARDNGPADGIAQALEAFPDVAVVPFHWVALLIFLYILLIGPVDYFLLKKVFKRLELTWITFPLWVMAISMAAYWSAYVLKGNELRVNRLEIVDLDQASGTLRGAAFVGVFSPRIAKYDVAYTSELAAAGKWGDLPAGPDAKAGLGDDQWTGVSSAYGVPAGYLRGVDSGGSLLGRRGYRTEPVANASLLGIKGAPVQVWSVKSFESRWLSAGKPAVDAQLRPSGVGFRGTVTNLLDVPLHDVRIVYGDMQVEIRLLPPKTPIDLAAAANGSQLGRTGNVGGTAAFDAPTLSSRVLDLSFQRANVKKTTQTDAGVRYLSDLDLSQQLELGRIVLIARVGEAAPGAAPSGGAFWLDQEPKAGAAPVPAPGKTVVHSFLRVVLDPVKEQP